MENTQTEQDLAETIARTKLTLRQAEKSLAQLRASKQLPVDKAALRKQAKEEKYRINNGASIHKLRLAGNDVLVSHIRYTPTQVTKLEAHDIPTTVLNSDGEQVHTFVRRQVPVSYTVEVPVPSFMRKFVEFSPRGGSTHIIIAPNDETTESIYLQSVCHEVDSFDYKLGIKLALDQLSEEDATRLLTVTPQLATA